MPSPPNRPPLQQAARTAIFALGLLILAGLRHHLVWGESARLPFSLVPVLNALELGCLVGFAWFGARAWLRGMAAVRDESPGVARLVVTSLPILVAAMLVPSFLSADVADYVMRGRVLALHGANPYVRMATDFPDDSFLVFGDAAWKQFPLPYGPLIADLQGAIAWLAHRFAFLPLRIEFLLAIGLFKLVFAACLLGSALVARSLCAQLRPADQDVVLIAVLWNPLLLNEGIASAHNESLVLLTLLLALRLALVGQAAAGGFALGLSVLTKIVPVLLGPLFLVWSLRSRQATRLLLGALGALLLLGLYYLRFFRDPGSLDFLQRQSGITRASLAWGMAKLLGVEVATALTAGRALVVVVMLAVCARLWRQPTPQHLLRGSAAILASMVCCGLAGFGAWYHIWWIPIALLSGPGYLQRFAWATTLTAPLCYVVWTGLRSLDEAHQWTNLAMGIVVPAVIAIVWQPRFELIAAAPAVASPPAP